jgi:hypothetical protein
VKLFSFLSLFSLMPLKFTSTLSKNNCVFYFVILSILAFLLLIAINFDFYFFFKFSFFFNFVLGYFISFDVFIQFDPFTFNYSIYVFFIIIMQFHPLPFYSIFVFNPILILIILIDVFLLFS